MTLASPAIAVLVPTLNEARTIRPLLETLRDGSFDEIVVCDGGSTDGTDGFVEEAPGVILVRSSRGRGVQINAAARASRSPIIVILHADTTLPKQAARIIRDTLADPRVDAGCFRLSFDLAHPVLNIYAWFSRFETGLTSFGDQAFFMHRAAFEAIGGAPDWPLLEDVALRSRLRRRGCFVKRPERVITSARRFVGQGLLRGQLRNAIVLTGYQLGFSIKLLADFYGAAGKSAKRELGTEFTNGSDCHHESATGGTTGETVLVVKLQPASTPVTLAHKEDAMTNARVLPSPRIAPLPMDHNPELKNYFANAPKSLGFVPNSWLIMQRKPNILKAFSQLTAALWDPADSKVDRGLKRLVAHMASKAAGCQYCMAHTIEGAAHLGVDEQKLAAIWDYQTSPLFSPAERTALDFAASAALQPNQVSDEDFAGMRQHFDEEQIVEIVAVISVFGFLNRFNDTMGTPLEEIPIATGEKYLASHGWTPGKHKR